MQLSFSALANMISFKKDHVLLFYLISLNLHLYVQLIHTNLLYLRFRVLIFNFFSQHGITCRGKPEESVLAVALLSLVDWLLTCIRSGHVPKNGTTNRLEDRIANKSIQILEYLLNNDFVFAMLYLAKHDDAGK